MQQQDKTDQLVLLIPEFHIWGATRKVRDDDVRSAVPHLPDAKCSTRGSVFIFDRDELKPHYKAKDSFIRFLASKSVAHGTAYLAPKAAIDEIYKEFQDCVASVFDARLQSLEANYDTLLQSWIAANPKDAALIQSRALSWTEVKPKFGAVLHASSIGMTGNDKADATIQSTMGGLYGALLQEIADVAKDSLENLGGRDRTDSRVRKTCAKLRDKLASFSFLDGSVSSLLGALDAALAQVPATGAIKGAEFTSLAALLTVLSEPLLMRDLAIKAEQDSSTDLVLQYAPASLVPEALAVETTSQDVVVEAVAPLAPVAPVVTPATQSAELMECVF